MIRGQGEAFARAMRQARALRLHHALVLEGGRGEGKTTAATWFTQALLCPSDDAAERDVPCGACPTCRKVASGNHPDAHVLTVPEEKQDIPVELVRELQSTLGQLPVEGRARVAMIDPADALNEQGQNALLKTLEEPGRDTWLLLTTARPEHLLPTVRSRVQRLRLRRLTDTDVLAALERDGCGDSVGRAWAASLARGSLGLARQLLADPDLRRVHDLCIAHLANPNMSAVAAARAALDGAGGRREAEQRARLVLLMLRRSLRPHAAEGATDSGVLASTVSGAYPLAAIPRWTDLMDALFDAEADLDLRIGPEQALAGVFLHVARATATSGSKASS